MNPGRTQLQRIPNLNDRQQQTRVLTFCLDGSERSTSPPGSGPGSAHLLSSLAAVLLRPWTPALEEA